MRTSLFFCKANGTKVPLDWQRGGWKRAGTLALCALLFLMVSGPALWSMQVAEAAPMSATTAASALPTTFSMSNVMMDNRGFGGRSGNGGSLLHGARVEQSDTTGYLVRFTVENVGAVTTSGAVGCVNDWITLLHNDQHHNIALRLRCNQLELHAHNGYDLAGPVIPFNFAPSTPLSLAISVRGQTITVTTATGAVLMQWNVPAAYSLPPNGRSVVLYVAGGSTACWDKVEGAPLT